MMPVSSASSSEVVAGSIATTMRTSSGNGFSCGQRVASRSPRDHKAPGIGTERWRAEVAHYLPLIARVLVQTGRRVLDGEIVPASEKLVSLFEPHADIIVKGRRQVQYGHKLNLATGKSGLILDIVIETGNPADAERFVSML